MDTPTAPKILFFFLLSILIVCSTVLFLSPVKVIEQHHDLQIQDQISHPSRRKLLTKTTLHDLVNFLSSNSPTSQITALPNTQTPTFVTIPPASSVSTTPTNPTNPPTSPATPGINDPGRPPTPVVAPPAGAGQSWCVAKSGVSEASLQTALDYACGHGADCSVLQQGGICYSPGTLKNHASYAFNSYCQKNPGQKTSCDFGGAATLTNVNPSSGSCTYPTLSSSTSPTTSTPTTTPTILTPTGSYSGSSATPPSILSGSNPDIGGTTVGFGGSQQPFISCIIVVTSFITGIIVLDI